MDLEVINATIAAGQTNSPPIGICLGLHGDIGSRGRQNTPTNFWHILA
jgi:hypothetical protein